MIIRLQQQSKGNTLMMLIIIAIVTGILIAVAIGNINYVYHQEQKRDTCHKLNGIYFPQDERCLTTKGIYLIQELKKP